MAVTESRTEYTLLRKGVAFQVHMSQLVLLNSCYPERSMHLHVHQGQANIEMQVVMYCLDPSPMQVKPHKGPPTLSSRQREAHG